MRRSVPAFLFLLIILLACQISEEESIHQTLNRREEAFQKKDISLYLPAFQKPIKMGMKTLMDFKKE